MNTQPFDAAVEIKTLQRQRAARRQRRYGKSVLEKYRVPIVALLKHEGGSYRLVAEWLRINKHIRVNHVTVMRFAKKLPELREAKHVD